LKRILSVALGAALLAAVPVTAHAAPAENAPEAAPRVHDLPNPLGDQQRAQRAAGLEKVLTGEATAKGANQVVHLGRGKYVELALEDTDAIWTVLGEFGDLKHNTIPAPNRKVDNTTIWTKDFSQSYFDKLLYNSAAGINSVANYYEELSSGQYSVTGEVENWVTVDDHPAAYYGEGDNDRRTWEFVNETLTTWWDSQVAAGKSAEQIDAYLAQFDVWDRYDYNNNGIFDEPDGYIDHFQAVHSGMGEEAGGGALGADAIWSHRWYNQTNPIGTAGPTVGDTVVKNGGAPVGGSKYWVGDYTVEPENGGVGVFAHEFGHDLGLPDLYDTSGNAGGAENSTAFWTLMSSGSYGNSGRPEDGIGTRPTSMGAWEKIQLGWIAPEVIDYGQKATVNLGPAAYNTRQEEAIVAVLPDREVTTTIGTPFEGPDFWYSGQGDNLDNTMLTALPRGATSLTAKVSYQIEQDWDYAYAGYVAPGTTQFKSIPTDRSTTENPNGQNFGQGITGTTGGQWVDLTVDVSGVPEGSQVGFRYWTDGAAAEPGFLADAVAIDGAAITDWALDGFTVTTGTARESFFNAYVIENRVYTGYDSGLKTGPYNFGDPKKPDWAERFPYQDGVLISYWNSQYTDNSVGAHPGAGLILPVDAHSGLLYEPTDDEADAVRGESWRARVQSYDSTFGRQRTDRITLHDPDTGVAKQYGGLPAVPSFDDRKDWYVAPGEQADSVGWTGVDVPKTGTRVTVQREDTRNNIATVRIN
jgi:immune inhibitor A